MLWISHFSKHCLAIAENEIDVALDVAIDEILSRWRTSLRSVGASLAGRVNRVLIAQQTHVAEDGAVSGHQQRQCLRTLRDLFG